MTDSTEPEVLGSLGMVACEADDPYLRVIAAELALEYIPLASAEVNEPTPNPIDALQRLVRDVNEAADGFSNDTEIQALQDALDAALARWPEIDRFDGQD